HADVGVRQAVAILSVIRHRSFVHDGRWRPAINLMNAHRSYRAGDTIEDHCRPCATDRLHTVVAADPSGHPLRVVCDFCRSEHNYRGGPRLAVPGAPAAGPGGREAASRSTPDREPSRSPAARDAFPIVSDRERTASPVMLPHDSDVDLELLLRR